MPIRRSTLILVGALGALGFVVLRVIYRVVFGGASTGATLLPHLPAVRLSGPFSHIQLFGPITLEGLTQAVVGALPFAAVIFLTATVVAWVDPSRVLMIAPRLRVGGRLLGALGIAFSTFPLVLAAVAASKKTAAFRGMKPGFRLFTPVLEHTVERARDIAMALHSRGIFHTDSRATPELATDSVVKADEFRVSSRMAGPVTLEFHPGQSLLITGATGAGKTTLLQALAGVSAPHQDLAQTGVLEIGGAQSQRGYLPHNPKSIFLTTRVVDDVALGLIARGVGTKEAEKKAHSILDELGISHLCNQAPWMLSSGEAVMAGLAVVLVTTPQLVLLDEPLTALDSEHRDIFLQALTRHQATMNAAVLLTHHPEDTNTIPGCDEYVLTDQGLLPGRFSGTIVPPQREATRPVESDVVAQVSNLSVVFGTRAILDQVSFDLHRGELVVISGRNGAGKSTLLEAVFDARLGTVQVLGQDLALVSPKDKVGLLTIVPSDPASLFVTSSVAEELAWADRVAGVEKGFTRLAFESILPEAWHREVVAKSDHTHPRDLSRGQQAALAVALQLSHKPAVIALDEPTRGLDESARKAFAEVIACVVETGTAVVVASHHDESDGLEPDRRLLLSDRRLRVAGVGVNP